jgi:6-pyruvoyltetrahydropterin/6-carboxytetrahydropterin synthase
MFDHTTIVAADDPNFNHFLQLHELKIIDLRSVDDCGCESFALLVFEELERWLENNHYTPRVTLVRLEVREHGGNSAYVRRR